MDTILFLVQDSASSPYSVSFTKTINSFTAACSCPAGKVGQYCKHRLKILNGNTEGIVSENKNEISTITSWLKGTEIEKALKDFQEMEERFELAKQNFTISKKRLTHALVG